MATFYIPNQEGQIRQVNRGDIFGELWSTKNIDLTGNPGKMQLAKKVKRVLTAGDTLSDATTFTGKARALLIFTDLDADAGRKHYYVFTNSNGYRCSVDSDPSVFANWTEVSASMRGDLSNSTDAVVFDGQIRFSRATDIARHNGGSSYADNWWTNDISGSALTTNKPHTMHVHKGGQETIIVTDGRLVRYYNSTAGHTTLTLSDSLVANTLTSGVDTIWVGTYTETSEDAYVYEFNIGNTLPNAAYRIEGRACLSMDVIDNIPYIVTDKGHIQRFDGAGFVTIASFPFADTNKAFFGLSPGLFSFSSPPVYPKGMRAQGRSLLINLKSTGQATTLSPIDERTHSGVWEYNVDTGVLNHRTSLADETTDAGYVRQNEAGPILPIGFDNLAYMVGAGTALDGLYVESTETPTGYFITPEYYGDSIQQAWEKIHAIATLNGGSITFKYRTSKQSGYPLYVNDVAWLDTNRFTTTADLSSVSVGDEVEIMAQYSAGKLAHVTKIEPGTTTTVTLDEAIGAATQSSDVRFQNWTKLPTEFTSGSYVSIGVTEVKPMIQFKVELTGDVELQRFITKGNAKTNT